MHVLFDHRLQTPQFTRRAGFNAVTEILLLLIMLPGLCLLGANWLVNVSNEATSSSKLSMFAVCRISLDRDGERLWIYRRCHDVTRLNLGTGEIERSLPLGGIELLAAAHSRDNSTSLLCAMDGSVALIREGETARTAQAQRNENTVDAAVSQTGNVAAFVTSSSHLRGWSQDGTEVQEFSYSLASNAAVARIGLGRTGHRLSVARFDGTVSFHQTETGIPEGEPLEIGEYCTGFAWSENERVLAAITLNGMVKVYDMAQKRLVFESITEFGHGKAPQTSLEVSSDGRWVAAGLVGSHDIIVWNIVEKKLAARLCGHVGFVRAIQFSPMSDRLYSGSFDGTVREWSLETFTQLRTIN